MALKQLVIGHRLFQRSIQAFLLVLTFAVPAVHADTVTVYSARNEQLIKPLFDAFTKETGTQVQVLTDKEGPLLERLKAEGSKTPADLLITVDAGNLWHASRMGLLRPIKSQVLNANIPPNLRDPRGEWYGLSVRARTIIYNKKFVNPNKLSTYEALADPEWKGKLCLRTSKKVYNQSLVATMIASMGESKTEQVVRGWVANLATDVFADDNGVIKAVAAGQCEVGIVNTYYLARALDKEPNLPVGLFWANQRERGVHVNVSGAGVTKYAPNPQGGQKLLEWLAGDVAQSIYTNDDFEYPANPRVKADSIIRQWGAFKMDLINVSKAGELQAEATRLMDRAGYR